MSMIVKAVSWVKIRQFYKELVEKSNWPLDEMLNLVEFLGTSAYSESLFAYTSHDILCIGRVENMVRGDNELRIQYDTSRHNFIFTYHQHPFEQNQWSTKCEETEWKTKLIHLLHKRLRWFK